MTFKQLEASRAMHPPVWWFIGKFTLQKPSQLPEVGSFWLFSAKEASEYALQILSQSILRTQKPQSCLCPYICSRCEMYQNLKETLWGSLITSPGQAKELVIKGCLSKLA